MRISLFFSGLLLLLSWLLPIHFLPWTTFYQEIFAALALGLALFSVAIAKTKWHFPFASGVVLLLSLIPFIQFKVGIISFAGDMWLSSFYLILLALSLAFGMTLQRIDREAFALDFLAGFSWLLVTGAVVSVLIAFGQWFGFSHALWVFPLQDAVRPYANLAQPNNLATLLGFGLAALWYLFETKKISTLFASGFAFLLIFCLALVESRTTWVSLIFISIFWLWQSKKVTFQLSKKHFFYWLLFYVFCLLMLPFIADAFGLKSSSLIEHAQSLHRWGLYEQFFTAILQGPWYGYGWGQVFLAQGMIAIEHPFALNVTMTHNVLLDLLIWNGPILGGVVILLVAIWWWQLLTKANNLIATYVWVALSFFIMHSMLEFPHAYTFLLIPAGIFLGVLQASVGSPFNHSIKMPRWILLLAALSIWGIGLVLWRDYGVVEDEYKINNLIQDDRFIPKEEQAVSQVALLTQLRASMYLIRMPRKEIYTEEQLLELTKTVQRYPRFYFLLKQAYVLALNGQDEAAFESMMRLHGLYGKDNFEMAIQFLYGESAEEPRLAPLLAKFGLPLKPAKSTEP